MIIVTGSNGFIGSNLITQLNDIGENEIIAVDDHSNADLKNNIAHCKISESLGINDFIKKIKSGSLDGMNIKAIFHQGACSNTMEWDANFLLENNYAYSKTLLNFAETNKIPFIYASSAAVYGSGIEFKELKENEGPINLYGYSKYLFDQLVRTRIKSTTSQIVGMRYFNVYGPNEQHKGTMASVAYHLNKQLQDDYVVRLFEGSGGYDDGEQRRDFIYIDDIVKVNLWFLRNPNISGIFNVGTGKSQTFNEVAEAVIDWNKKGSIKYIPFPKKLEDSYQSFTEADIASLREAGYKEEFLNVSDGVKKYLTALSGWPKNDQQ